MGLFKSSKKDNDASLGDDAPAKKSLWQKRQDMKRGNEISEEDILKYTGKSRAELNSWAENQPGVGKNQLAGKLALGPTAGLFGASAGEGAGGWGMGHEPGDAKNRGLKFPPTQQEKKLDDGDSLA